MFPCNIQPADERLRSGTSTPDLPALAEGLASQPVAFHTRQMRASADTSVSPDTAVAELSFAIDQLLRRLRAGSNPDELTWPQTAALSELEKGGAMTTADLARAKSIKPQSMSATLAELEREGLVARRPHPTDGRQILYDLTADGLEARRKRTALKRKWLLDAVAKLDPEEKRTLMAAVAVIKRLGDSNS